MMLKHFLLSFTTYICSIANPQVDQNEPLSYFRAAEDISASNQLSTKDINDIRHLYVIAAVLDPSLRDNSILGLIEIEKDPILKSKLYAMRGNTGKLLVADVLTHKDSPLLYDGQEPAELCKTVVAIRNGKKIEVHELENLRPWRYLFPKIFDRVSTNSSRDKLTSPLQVFKTIKVELAILGGPSLWSADYVYSEGRPVSFSLNDDLASLLEIDSTKVIRRDGRWVSE